MRDLHLLLVNPPDVATRPDGGNTGTLYIANNQIVRCINSGILSIASYIHAKGREVAIVDLLQRPDLDPLRDSLARQHPRVIGISCSHGFSYLPTLACAQLARQVSPGSLIVVGGQHIGPLGRRVFADSQHIDIVVKYEGEVPTDRLISHFERYGPERPPSDIAGLVYRDAEGSVRDSEGTPTFVDLDEMPFLEFELYPEYKSFNPYVEESRGCSFGCNYCSANHMNLARIRVKSYDRFLAELKHTATLYGTDPLYPVLASTFGTRVDNTMRIVEGMRNVGVRWTTELRADGAWPMLLDAMYESGFRIATVGLESASPEILIRMNKTKHPEQYISRARELITTSAQYPDLLLKLNVILYIGETPQTIRETLSFLLRYSCKLAAVRFSPLFGFPGSPFLRRFAESFSDCGASLVTEGYWGASHVYPVNVSRYFSFDECARLSNILEKVFTDEEVYFKANQYTYGLKDVEEIRERVTQARISS